MAGPTRQRTFNFWLGRAGSGKTHAVIEAAAEALRASPRGAPLLILVPEQAGAQTEYRLATAPGLGGYTRARVLTFRNLTHLVFEETGGRPQGMIDEETRILILRRVIGRRRSELGLLGSCADLPGLADSVSRTLTEFARYGWRRGDLEARASLMEGESLLRSKLRDLALLWEGYEEFLAERGLGDEIAAGALAAERLRDLRWLDGAKLWIDGFVSFTTQEMEIIFAMLERVESATLALCLDPEGLCGPGARRIGNERIFENVEKTYHTFRGRLAESGWHCEEFHFPAENQPSRFSASPALLHLESKVLGRLEPVPAPDLIKEGQAHLSLNPGGPITLIEAEDLRAEVTAAARRMSALAAQGVEWNAMTLLTRDLESYAPLVREIFPRHGIPFFLDSPRTLAPHPIARLITSALKSASKGFDETTAIDHLKSGLTPLAQSEEIFQIERFARRSRFSSEDWEIGLAEEERTPRHHPWTTPEGRALRQAWRRAAAPAMGLRLALERTPEDPAGALWNFLTRCGTATELARWIEELRAEGRHEAAMIHEAAWGATLELLDRIDRIGPDETGAPGLLDAVETGLATVRAALVPPTLDQVLVGSVERSRVPEVEAAFVLGLSDGAFPKAYDEDPMIGDLERRELTGTGRELGPDSAARFNHERFLAYVALTRASRMLFLSRPIAGGAGESSFYRAVREAFGLVPGYEQAAFAPPTFRERAGEWAARAATAFHAARAGSGTGLARLLASAPPRLEHDEAGARRTLLTLLPGRPPEIDPGLIRLWWEESATLGVTAFETHARCPFKFFTGRMLRIEREVLPLPGTVELGNLRHHMLQHLFNRLNKDGMGVRWGELDLDEARLILNEVAEHALDPSKPSNIADQFGRDSVTRALVTLTTREMEHFTRALKAMGERYGFVQIASEFVFGDREAREVSLATDAGVTFKLQGSVDRVDHLDKPLGSVSPLVVFDYKSSVKKLDPGLVIAGVNLQLPVYGLVIEQMPGRNEGRREVVGFFYWPLSIGHSDATGDETGWAEPGTEAWFKNRRPSGVFREDCATLLDHTVKAQGSALAFNFRLTKNGALNNSGGDWLPAGAFRELTAAAAKALRERAGELARGVISLQPLRHGSRIECEECDARTLCRRDFLDQVAPRFVRGIGVSTYRKQAVEKESTP